MRPRLLEMEGFLPYRHRTEVDFEDADLFVLSGPTGAGKSSVIDAIIFALYGTIPRLDDRRAVEPVVSVRSGRARVAFTFTVEGETYRVGRLVERRGTGASTTEARLERDGEVVASGAAEVTDAVTELLGLGFDHFTKAVVLPQGAFARFLLDQPRDRQALLRALLDLGVFEQVMQLANGRAAAAKARLEVLEERLGKLDVPGEEDMARARSRLERLEGAQRELEGRLGGLRAVITGLAQAEEMSAAVADNLERLRRIRAPDGLETWESDRDQVQQALAAAQKRFSDAEVEVASLQQEIAGHPERSVLEGWRETRARLRTLEQKRSALDLDRLAAEADSAAEQRDKCRHDLEQAHIANAAHHLRSELKVGDVCPVCRGTVTELDEEPETFDDEALRVAAEEAERKADLARDRLKEAEGAAGELEETIAELIGRLAQAPDDAMVAHHLAALSDLEERRLEVERVRAGAAAEVESLRASLTSLEEAAATMRDALLDARDLVAGEGPPRPVDDLVESWRGLIVWRDGRIEELAKRQEELLAELGRLRSEAERVEAEIGRWLEDLEVEQAANPETDLALAIERARSEVAALEETIEEAAALQSESSEEARKRQVASELAKHLRANNFEAWITEEALEVLVEGANRLLDDLSGGAYSLVVRDRHFQVIDHLNAGAVRTTKGLSGGETFLVSLSLSLSMAEQLARLTGTASRLESVFLDEGFGSLDQESLDVVAAILDQLVGRGRMVGIVTHVRDLADRIPVRFEVSKGVESATIRKVAG